MARYMPGHGYVEIDPRILEAAEVAKGHLRAWADDHIDRMVQLAHHRELTPIEALFGIAFEGLEAGRGRRVRLISQVPIGAYTADWVAVFSSPSDAVDDVQVVVECDGHNFHERTPEQAEHDRRRDRWMIGQGYMVTRFTGRELWRDPHHCAREVVALALGELERRERPALFDSEDP